uniref:YhfT family protein n=1 Tax=Streptobacillus felis TaxID=1384509 RepID=UPI000AAF2136
VLIARQLVSVYGKFAVGSATISLNADGIALLVGIIVMLFFAINDKTESTNSNATLLGLFSERVAKVRKNILIISLMDGLASA